MKKILVFLCCFGLFSFTQAKNIQAYLSYATFFSPTDGPYVETYLATLGKSVVFKKNVNNKYQAVIEVTIIFKQDDKVKNFKKIELKSPEANDSASTNFNFLDQQRFLLPNGSYTFEIQVLDKNNTQPPYKYAETIVIDYPATQVNISGIELIESFKPSSQTSILTKNGYDLIPYVADFYPKNINTLVFYSEIYNTDKIIGNNQKFLVSYYIEASETNKSLSSFIVNKVIDTKPVNVLFNQFDINQLPSGNYNLVIEARDKDNKLISLNKLFFQRSNPSIQYNLKDIASISVENTFVGKMNSVDTLKEYIRSLEPISSELEKEYEKNQLKKADLLIMKQYFYNFWMNRDRNNPELAWLNYKLEVDKANANYATRTQKAYETDRGRVFLQYGPPNSIVSKREPGKTPYEIWHYYVLNNQRNVKFVFITQNIVTNDYELVHSTAKGEIYNYTFMNSLEGKDDHNDYYFGDTFLNDYNNPK